ncbi:MAG: glutamate/gamma-aminobutyrate family transporter YjeM, partial [Clostridium sp.]
SPLKTLIQGAPKEIWPGKLGEIEDGMPKNAMKLQAGIVMIMILLVSFGGSNASKFFTILTLMTNVAMTIPYMFLAIAFPAFKKKQLSGKLDAPFKVYKSQGISTIVAIVVTAVIGFANIFTIVEPLLSSPMRVGDTIAMVGGPLTFSIVAVLLFNNYEKKYLKNKDTKNKVAS